MNKPARGPRDRLILVGLVGAGLVTLTWWTLLAAGLWQALGWVTA